MVTRAIVRLHVVWLHARARLSGDRGSYMTDVSVSTAVLVVGAIVIGGIIIAFGEEIANALQFGPSAPGQP